MADSAMTVREVAEYLNVHPKVVYRLAHSGELPGFRVSTAWRFKRPDIDRWIEAQKKSRSAPATECCREA